MESDPKNLDGVDIELDMDGYLSVRITDTSVILEEVDLSGEFGEDWAPRE